MVEPSNRERDGWTRSVLRVGGGRGFVVETQREDRFIITAGHCLPHLPPSHAANAPEAVTYPRLICPLGAEPTVWAECAFVDPVADLAVLTSPDLQALWEEAVEYDTLLRDVPPLPIGKLTFKQPPVRLLGSSVPGPAIAESAAWMLSLDGEWFSCCVTSRGRALWITDATQPIQGGMSGSPVLSTEGTVIGVVCVSEAKDREGGPNPELAAALPGWLLRTLGQTSVTLRLAEDVTPRAKRS